MMVRVTRSNNNPAVLWIAVQPKFPLGDHDEVWFQRECASELECQMLCELLQRKLGENQRELRKTSYFRGWKHAKAKKGGKRIWFPTAMSVLPWEREEVG